MTRLRAHHSLTLVPVAGILVGVPFANRVHANVLGLPFLLAWILGCVILTAAIMTYVGWIDRKAEAAAPRSAPGDAAHGDAGEPRKP